MVSLTRTPAWRALSAHQRSWGRRSLRELFAADPQRFQRFSLEACGLLLDYSKNLIVPETLELLLALARERGLPDQIRDLLAGKRVNTTEKRAAWHTALRAGEDAPREVRKTLAAMRKLATALRDGKIFGANGHAITDVVSLGIGGSVLGPALAAAACAPDAGSPRVHFIHTPGESLERLLATLDAANTLFIVQSKSFSTQETLLNARAARAWLQTSGIADHGAHFAAVTANSPAAEAFGVAQERIFPMWDWVGGRYSLWSAVGLPAMIAMGADAFDELLAGAAEMDAHFASAALDKNMPVLLALIGLWHSNFFAMASRAVIPYQPGLGLLPAWLQQLETESLGKSVSRRGKTLRQDTGPVLWGSAGTEGQHAYFQLLHQGTRPVPVDFITSCAPRSKSPWGAPRSDDADQTHAVMLSNCFAQSALLMCGVSAAETEQALLQQSHSAREAARLAPHQALPGNRPSNTLLLPVLDARSLGALLALYEHRTFVQSAIWDINAFDQWGVEHGKRLAGGLLPEFTATAPATAHDASTDGLIAFVKKQGKKA
ncbi:MAG: glucose-6-phosphate isomerase [Burkholderiales bacterium]|jgi:glucose-6-phosphate isomerase|nr:glucose-6-phosphate isomerase [Burkholderiales bacterium]